MDSLDRILATVALVALMTCAVVLGLGDVLDGDRVLQLLVLVAGVAAPSPIVSRGSTKPPE